MKSNILSTASKTIYSGSLQAVTADLCLQLNRIDLVVKINEISFWN